MKFKKLVFENRSGDYIADAYHNMLRFLKEKVFLFFFVSVLFLNLKQKKEAELKLKKYLIEQLRYGAYTFEGQTYRSEYSLSKDYPPLTSKIRAKIIDQALLNFEILELKKEDNGLA